MWSSALKTSVTHAYTSRTQEAKVGYQKFRVSLGYSRAGEMVKCLPSKYEH